MNSRLWDTRSVFFPISIWIFQANTRWDSQTPESGVCLIINYHWCENNNQTAVLIWTPSHTQVNVYYCVFRTWLNSILWQHYHRPWWKSPSQRRKKKRIPNPNIHCPTWTKCYLSSPRSQFVSVKYIAHQQDSSKQYLFVYQKQVSPPSWPFIILFLKHGK